MQLRKLAEILQGTVHGNPEIEISGVSGIAEAAEGDITFLGSPKYAKHLRDSKASCVIVRDIVEGIAATQLKVENPSYAFARAIECMHPSPPCAHGISSLAEVSSRAEVGDSVSIYPFVHISDGARIGDGTVIMSGTFIGEGVKIGARCLVYPNVVVRERVTIGDRVIIHPGVVIGADGFGFVFDHGVHYKIPQVGGVMIGDDVEIGANTTIDRGTIGNTVIGKGTKIDNLVQIAHNVTIGERSLIVAQVGIGGSSAIGDFVTIAGQSGIADHTAIASGTVVAAQSGLAGTIPKGVYSGSPAMAHGVWLRAQALFSRLPDLHKRIRELEEKIHRLEKGGTP